MKRAFLYMAIGLVVSLCVGKVGQMDYQDAQQKEKRYCEMVEDKTWPDYDGTYEEMCRKYIVQRLTQPLYELN